MTIRNICDRAGVFTLFFYPPFSSKASQTQNGITTINVITHVSITWSIYGYCNSYTFYTQTTPLTWEHVWTHRYYIDSCTGCITYHRLTRTWICCSFPPNSLSRKYVSDFETSTYSIIIGYIICSASSYFTLSGMCIYTISTFISSTTGTHTRRDAITFYTSLCWTYKSVVIVKSHSNQIYITHKTISIFCNIISSQYITVTVCCCGGGVLPISLVSNSITPIPEFNIIIGGGGHGSPRVCHIWIYTVYSSYFIECVVTVFTPASLLPSSSLGGFCSLLTFTGSCTVLTLTIPLCYTGFIEVLENGESMIQIPLN